MAASNGPRQMKSNASYSKEGIKEEVVVAVLLEDKVFYNILVVVGICKRYQ
jgi:hypothetical protein